MDQVLQTILTGGVIGAMLSLVGVLITQNRQGKRHSEVLRQGRELENHRAQEAALQKYFELMGELLVDPNHPLHHSKPGDTSSTVARAQTLSILAGLDDPARKRILLEFLYETTTIYGGEPVVSLRGANLREANLRDANLIKVNLSETNLSGADLSKADLSGADLSKADLSGADLSKARLREADLSEANLSGANLSWADESEVEQTLGPNVYLYKPHTFTEDMIPKALLEEHERRVRALRLRAIRTYSIPVSKARELMKPSVLKDQVWPSGIRAQIKKLFPDPFYVYKLRELLYQDPVPRNSRQSHILTREELTEIVKSSVVGLSLEGEGADLREADLSGANLQEAFLSGTVLALARGLTAEQIEWASGDATTMLPSYLQHPEEWLREQQPSGN